MSFYDKVIIGAGIYGLYAAIYSSKKNPHQKVLILEKESHAFTRATYINQARVHMGYHYPRSFSTAIKSAHYFDKFVTSYPSSIYSDFDQIYATSSNFSWTNANQFGKFCKAVDIDCKKIDEKDFFKESLCDGAFLTKEYTYDAMLLKEKMLDEISNLVNIDIRYDVEIKTITKKEEKYIIDCGNLSYETSFLLNATYASINQILNKLNYEEFNIKYELCEIIICSVNEKLDKTGITVMDGPFFSIMPFGKTGFHSLTSVTFTPHQVSYEKLPTFDCQKGIENYCNPTNLGNCNNCPHKPKSSWIQMSSLARKYLVNDLDFKYEFSLYSMKPILIQSEIDDSRPTVIKKYSSNPDFYTVLSGKINTIYDLEEIL